MFICYFSWTQESDDEFFGVFANVAWKLKSSKTHLYYEVIGELPYRDPEDVNVVRKKAKGKLLYGSSHYKSLLNSYLRLDSDLKKDYAQWKTAHKHFASNTSDEESLITQLNQDVVENIFSFICSQNNHITRISLLVEKLCSNFGEKICDYKDRPIYAFPTLEALNKQEDLETKLRELGFGYRAKFIQASAREMYEKGGLKWLQEIEQMDYHDAHKELCNLTGIGPKVADCICLMSLSFLQAVPVDTHIIQIASHYLPELPLKPKSMNLTTYKKIGDAFREAYGEKAGWAQTVLFCKELVRFKEKSNNDDISRKKLKTKK